MVARTVSAEGDLLVRLKKHLDAVEADAIEGVLRGLPPETYHFARGRIELVRSIRDVVIPQIIEDLRKD